MTFARALPLLLLAAAPLGTQAAESYDNCTGFIDSLPATISTQGTWCLRKDLATAVASGAAITVATNNVTVDCNHFKLGGLAAGDASTTVGVYSAERSNTVVRHCNIRGFHNGVALTGNGGGHLVEDNRFDNNLSVSINLTGHDNLVRRNLVFDTGGFSQGESAPAYGVVVYGSAVDNTVTNVVGRGTFADARGIVAFGTAAELRGNVVSGILRAGGGNAVGIYTSASGIRITNNHVFGLSTAYGAAIYGGGAETFCDGNTASGFQSLYVGCEYSRDNLPAAP